MTWGLPKARGSIAQLEKYADYCAKLSQTAAIAFGAQVGSIQLGLMNMSWWAAGVALELMVLAVGFLIASSSLYRRSE